ncbi:hypothetical protein HAX54_049371 [Datura stramonium]|uniref:Uncharacterized protein n=1 Tax=Datura stramonium TaxID=4076 RepID=A0ABS8SUS3_DATST|nr:hypothetical protein [Datura stramonium]
MEKSKFVELCLKEVQSINFVNVTAKGQNPCAHSMHFFTKDHRRVSIQSVANQLDMVCSNESRSILLFIGRSSSSRIMQQLVFFKICDCSDMKCLRDLCYLDQLEELKIKCMPHLVLPQLDAFPKNLKKLAFTCTCFPLEDLKIVGKLPKLESLRLAYDACVGEEWEVVEEGFPRLKFLLLKFMGIKYWRASSDHFPRLERLFLQSCRFLDSIPRDFADIMTLTLIDIRRCAESVGNSAKLIQQDIQDNYAGSVEVCIS